MQTTINGHSFPLQKGLFFLRNRWKAPKETRTDFSLGHLRPEKTGGYGPDFRAHCVLRDKDDYLDLVPWLFIPVEGTDNQFYLRSHWNGKPVYLNQKEIIDQDPDEIIHGSPGQHLSFWQKEIQLYPEDNVDDLTPWEFTPVDGSDCDFHIRNQWRAPDEKRVGMHLSFKGHQALLYPKDNTADLTPWRLVPARLSQEEVTSIIRNDLKDQLASNVKISLADRYYYTPSVTHVKDICSVSRVNNKRWLSERYDCDDFAISLKRDFAYDAYHNLEYTGAHAFGILWGTYGEGGHAVNWFIGDDLKLRIVEPQNDSIYTPDSDEGQKFSNIYFINA